MKTIAQFYRESRLAGMRALESIRTARIVHRFEELEQLDLVKLEATQDDDDYFSVYGEPDGYTDIFGRHVSSAEERKNIERMIERDGILSSHSYYRMTDEDKWVHADSCGMHVGYRNVLDWRENWYIVDHMAEAISQFENVQSNMLEGIV